MPQLLAAAAAANAAATSSCVAPLLEAAGSSNTSSSGSSRCSVRLSSSTRRRSPNVAAAAGSGEDGDVRLADLQASPTVDQQGLVNPQVPGGEGCDYKAFVFALYDPQLKLQYIGFSADLRNTLRTLLGRRPDKAHYYKAVGLTELNQEKMVAIRNGWFEQLGGAPIGNKLPMERNMWQQPVDAGAISARGKRGAAEECVRQLQEKIKLMGCTEEFQPNEQLLDDGMVDFLPVGGISEDTTNALKAAKQEAQARTRKAKATIDGQDQIFEVRYDQRVKTNGGYMVDVAVTLDNRTTRHRIVVGDHYIGGQGLETPDAAVESALAATLEAKLPRQTEGLMSMGMFPTNYFSVAGADQWFPEEFARAFEWNAGRPFKSDNDKAWRFTRMRSYGAAFADEQARLEQQAAEAQKRREDEEADAEYAENSV